MKHVLAAAAAALALAAPATAVAFSLPNDPLAPRQWYLGRDRALDIFDAAKGLFPVRVAVIDSGIDASHPELRGRIAAQKSFVGGTMNDQFGHGTFVAGEIAAIADNGAGIAGLAPPARLVIAKVVEPDGTIPPKAEARAIRWAVRQRARVINLSFGSVRDPNGVKDGYSSAERQAIEYAVRRGVLVVAAVGNGTDAPAKPWPYASYPAAFPHVLGVSSYGKSGRVPMFSNRDGQYVDISAPGMDIVSLFPRLLTKSYPTCVDQGYSVCGTKEYRNANGTSFSTPQVTAAAALLFGDVPVLRPDQVSQILRTSADDAKPANGCDECTPGPDALTGWGRLDIGAARSALAAGGLPPADRLEPNDDTGSHAATVNRKLNVRATLDWWDDPTDVYRVYLRRGQRMSVVVASAWVDPSLILWKPGLRRLADARSDLRARRSIHASGVPERVTYRAFRNGWYYVQVKLARPAIGPYRIRLAT